MTKKRTPSVCLNCRYWQPTAIDPERVHGEALVGVCAPLSVTRDCGVENWSGDEVATFAPLLTRPGDACRLHKRGEPLGRWWEFETGECPRPKHRGGGGAAR